MGQASEELRSDIEQRRANMTDTIDAIEDRVVPSRIIQRRRNAVTGWAGGVKDRVMGTAQGRADQAGAAMDRVGSTVSHASDAVSEAPAQVGRATAGSPLIAGGIAFGVGALIAALLPETQPERDAAKAIQPQVEAATDAVKEAGQTALDTAKSSAQDAMEDLKSSAADHAHEVAEQAKDAGSEVSKSAT